MNPLHISPHTFVMPCISEFRRTDVVEVVGSSIHTKAQIIVILVREEQSNIINLQTDENTISQHMYTFVHVGCVFKVAKYWLVY